MGQLGWAAIGIAIPVIALNTYLIWANKRRPEHDEIQAEADEQ